MLTIKQIQTLAPGSPVPHVAGRLRGVSAYEKGEDDQKIPYSQQDIFLDDETGSIACRVSNQPPFAPEDAVNGTRVFFLATKKPNGGYSGIRIDEEQGMVDGALKLYKLLNIGRSAQLVGEDQFMAAVGSPVSAPAAPAIQAAAPAEPVHAMPGQSSVPAQVQEAPPAKRMLQVSELRFDRTVDFGNGSTERLGVTILLEPGAKAIDALSAARAFVDKNLVMPAPAKQQI